MPELVKAKPQEFAIGGRPQASPVETSERFVAFVHRWWPSRLVAAIFSPRLAENAVPLTLLTIVIVGLSLFIKDFFSEGNILSELREVGEVGFVALGMLLVVVVGGIDLSVGAIFALCDFAILLFVQYLQWPVVLAIPVVLILGGLLGTFNGVLIGYLRLRAFLTTLISIVIFRAIFETLVSAYGGPITAATSDSDLWNLLAFGEILGLALPVWLCAIAAIALHILLTRLRPGWHIMAIGGSRRAAHNAGIPVARTVMLCYTASGVLSAISAIFFAARLGDLGSTVGAGLEVKVLTAIIAGGILLGGGKGTVIRALLGLLIVLLLVNGLTELSLPAGVTSITLATLLIVAATFESLLSNRSGAATMAPEYLRLADAPLLRATAGMVWRTNNLLGDAASLAVDQVDGPDDIIFDRAGTLFASSRHGDIRKFCSEDFTASESLAHIGSATLGMAFDGNGSLYVCAGEMGLYRVSSDGVATKATDQLSPSLSAGSGDRRLRFCDDLDVAPDGRVFFSENGSWPDLFKTSASGRIICFNPSSNSTQTVVSGLHFPNGVSLAPDRQSILIALTTECAVKRFWFDGPKKGRLEDVLTNLPGHPGNINPASDGHYWMSLVGGRSPAVDLAWRMPGFRKRMALQLPQDEWPMPQMNLGGVVKFSVTGQIIEVLWELGGEKFPMITSVREHEGCLYLGGGANNKIGRHRLPATACDAAFNQTMWQWGAEI